MFFLITSMAGTSLPSERVLRRADRPGGELRGFVVWLGSAWLGGSGSVKLLPGAVRVSLRPGTTFRLFAAQGKPNWRVAGSDVGEGLVFECLGL